MSDVSNTQKHLGIMAFSSISSLTRLHQHSNVYESTGISVHAWIENEWILAQVEDNDPFLYLCPSYRGTEAARDLDLSSTNTGDRTPRLLLFCLPGGTLCRCSG